MMRYWLLLLITACKFAPSPSDTKTSLYTPEDDVVVNLDISPVGMSINVNGLAPPQRFFRAHTGRMEFKTADITQAKVTGAPIVFGQLVFAWRYEGNTYTCMLEEVKGSRRIYPENSCYRQDANEDYLRQFVEWCVQDNKATDPFQHHNGKWYCQKTKIAKQVDIPFHCFTDKGNSCFLPTTKKIKESRISLYLMHQQRKGGSSRLSDLLEELYAQVKNCGESGYIGAQGFFCLCGEERPFRLAGKDGRLMERKCSTNSKYHYFSTFVP